MRVYLDKNVLTEVTKSKASDKLKELRLILESGNFFIPFTDAHIQDMMKSDSNYHPNDLASIDIICKSAYFQRDITKNNEVNYFIATANEVYESIRQEPDVLNYWEQATKGEEPFDKMLNSLSQLKFCPNLINYFPAEFQHPVYERVKRFSSLDAILDMHQFYEMSVTLYSLFRDNPVYYKELRNYLSGYVKLNLHDHKYLRSLQDINNAFDEKLGKTFTSFIEDITGKGRGQEVTFSDQLYQTYMMLDQFGLMTDKLNKKNTYVNMSNDAHHALYASYCDVLISEDGNMREKSAKVYELLGVKTKVVSVDDFIKQYGSNSVFSANNLFEQSELIAQEVTVDGRYSDLYKECFWGFYFDKCECFTHLDSGKSSYLFYSQKYYRGLHYLESEILINHMHKLFGEDINGLVQYDREENKTISSNDWKGRTWMFENLTLHMFSESGLRLVMIHYPPLSRDSIRS